MPVFVALLRAVNVGGTGKLPMQKLRAMCEAEGFACVRTYIASGNAVFHSSLPAARIKTSLEARLGDYLSKPAAAHLRTAAELEAVLAANPFPNAPGNLTYVHFLEAPASQAALKELKSHKDEEVRLGKREIYVYYPSGMGQSKLVIPAAKSGTARNMNTVARLVEMTRLIDRRKTTGI